MLISKTNKMKNIKYIILALSGFFLVTSCDRDLDINPAQSITTDQAISTPENINNILTHIKQKQVEPLLQDLATNPLCDTEFCRIPQAF